jgi:hypothetical protein
MGRAEPYDAMHLEKLPIINLVRNVSSLAPSSCDVQVFEHMEHIFVYMIAVKEQLLLPDMIVVVRRQVYQHEITVTIIQNLISYMCLWIVFKLCIIWEFEVTRIPVEIRWRRRRWHLWLLLVLLIRRQLYLLIRWRHNFLLRHSLGLTSCGIASCSTRNKKVIYRMCSHRSFLCLLVYSSAVISPPYLLIVSPTFAPSHLAAWAIHDRLVLILIGVTPWRSSIIAVWIEDQELPL